jgi:hypothetical protein
VTSPSPAPTYRIVFADDEQVSPCPSEIWYSPYSADSGAIYWERKTGRKCKVVEEKP